jgi:hypothetical protein
METQKKEKDLNTKQLTKMRQDKEDVTKKMETQKKEKDLKTKDLNTFEQEKEAISKQIETLEEKKKVKTNDKKTLLEKKKVKTNDKKTLLEKKKVKTEELLTLQQKREKELKEKALAAKLERQRKNNIKTKIQKLIAVYKEKRNELKLLKTTLNAEITEVKSKKQNAKKTSKNAIKDQREVIRKSKLEIRNQKHLDKQEIVKLNKEIKTIGKAYKKLIVEAARKKTLEDMWGKILALTEKRDTTNLEKKKALQQKRDQLKTATGKVKEIWQDNNKIIVEIRENFKKLKNQKKLRLDEYKKKNIQPLATKMITAREEEFKLINKYKPHKWKVTEEAGKANLRELRKVSKTTMLQLETQLNGGKLLKLKNKLNETYINLVKKKEEVKSININIRVLIEKRQKARINKLVAKTAVKVASKESIEELKKKVKELGQQIEVLQKKKNKKKPKILSLRKWMNDLKWKIRKQKKENKHQLKEKKSSEKERIKSIKKELEKTLRNIVKCQVEGDWSFCI